LGRLEVVEGEFDSAAEGTLGVRILATFVELLLSDLRVE